MQKVYECEDCGWSWPLSTAPPDGAECDNCGGALAGPTWTSGGHHRYTVDAYIVGAQPYPCTICGEGRNARVHRCVDRERSDAEQLRELTEWDWIVTDIKGGKLHHLAAFDDPEQAGDDWGGPGSTSCGRHTQWASIPGIFTRMGAARCKRCCKAVGFPEGVGSPKNDKALRPLVEARIGG